MIHALAAALRAFPNALDVPIGSEPVAAGSSTMEGRVRHRGRPTASTGESIHNALIGLREVSDLLFTSARPKVAMDVRTRYGNSGRTRAAGASRRRGNRQVH